MSKFNFKEIVNLRHRTHFLSVRPKRAEKSRGEPQKICRPSEQIGIPRCRFLWGACPAHRRA
ncbi:hypothetical protein GAV31_22540 [Salmonella enterica subsp. enterica]|nr:hypothetical protein [Salmonella enterica subsp. diarizonae]EDC6187927.1 hypothetical protein [Salmonella enterica subsp. enterica serovar Schwarzengrund]